jgi:hypothetical protein
MKDGFGKRNNLKKIRGDFFSGKSPKTPKLFFFFSFNSDAFPPPLRPFGRFLFFLNNYLLYIKFFILSNLIAYFWLKKGKRVDKIRIKR